ncbi:MAG: cell division protein ZapA [Pseudomonadota bacterium]
MAEVALTINGRVHTIACGDGEEDHLRLLAGHLDEKVADLVDKLGQIGEARLLVMAGLMIADELSDAYTRLASLEGGEDAAEGAQAAPLADQAAAAATLDHCAERLEALAARVEQA